jgi:hypothetical protein
MGSIFFMIMGKTTAAATYFLLTKNSNTYHNKTLRFFSNLVGKEDSRIEAPRP